MPKLIPSRTAQWPLVAEFTFKFDDTVTATDGRVLDFGKTNVAATSFVAIPLPPGATVLSGEVVTDVAFDAATFNVSVGDTTSAARYLAATDHKAVGRTELVPTGYKGIGENVVVGFQAAGVCTTGQLTVRIMYTVANRTSEVQIA